MVLLLAVDLQLLRRLLINLWGWFQLESLVFLLLVSEVLLSLHISAVIVFLELKLLENECAVLEFFGVHRLARWVRLLGRQTIVVAIELGQIHFGLLTADGLGFLFCFFQLLFGVLGFLSLLVVLDAVVLLLAIVVSQVL